MNARIDTAAPQAAPVDPLREALTHTAARLMAAISLLERGGKAAKKAAPSDKMFDQMLTDYRAAVDSARAALAAAPQPASVDREALVDVITRAMRKANVRGDSHRYAIADDLIAAGLRLPGAVQPTMRDETGMEHIARDIREGRFPKRSPRQQVPDTPDQPDETLAWAVEGIDGRLSLRGMAGSRADAERAAWVGDRVVRVAIRIVEGEA